jgi:hypothetical protein
MGSLENMASRFLVGKLPALLHYKSGNAARLQWA